MDIQFRRLALKSPPLGPKWGRWVKKLGCTSDPPVCSLLVWEDRMRAHPSFFAHLSHLGPSGGDFKASRRNCPYERPEDRSFTLAGPLVFDICGRSWRRPREEPSSQWSSNLDISSFNTHSNTAYMIYIYIIVLTAFTSPSICNTWVLIYLGRKWFLTEWRKILMPGLHG